MLSKFCLLTSILFVGLFLSDLYLDLVFSYLYNNKPIGFYKGYEIEGLYIFSECFDTLFDS